MNKRKHSNNKSNHSSSTTTIVHIVISLLVIYIYHYYYSIFFTIRENKRLDQALFKVSMFFFLASTFTYMLIIYELVKDKKALFYFNVYRLVELRLYQAGDIHRVGKPDVIRILPQQGDDGGMGPLVWPPGCHADHRRLGPHHIHHLPGGGGQAGVVGHL